MLDKLRHWRRRLATCFVAGSLTVLPLVVTAAIVFWVTGVALQYLGPNTYIGGLLERIGVQLGPNSTMPYLLGWGVVLLFVLGIGALAEFGVQRLLHQWADRLIGRIPIIGSVYTTSRQLIEMLEKKDDTAVSGMSSVFCRLGSTRILALLVSPTRFQLAGGDHYCVIIPTAPVPFGGALVFVPAADVEPANVTPDALMSIYVSMGVSAHNYLPVSAAAGTDANSTPS